MQKWSVRPCLHVVVLLCLLGCAKWEKQQGVHNRWRDPSLPMFKIGETTQSDVTAALGPPSQIISMDDQTIFYYLMEEQNGKALVLILFNWSQMKTIYDRAIFFFDPDGILLDFSYSSETAGAMNTEAE